MRSAPWFGRTVLALGLAAGAAGCSHAAAEDPVPADFSVSLSRSACYGTCPIYSVTIAADGTVGYHGEKFVAVTGFQARTITPEKVREVYDAIEKANVFALEDEYVGPVTDFPTYELSVTYKGRTKRIEDYAGKMADMPKSVTEIEEMIDDVAGTRDWINGDAP